MNKDVLERKRLYAAEWRVRNREKYLEGVANYRKKIKSNPWLRKKISAHSLWYYHKRKQADPEYWAKVIVAEIFKILGPSLRREKDKIYKRNLYKNSEKFRKQKKERDQIAKKLRPHIKSASRKRRKLKAKNCLSENFNDALVKVFYEMRHRLTKCTGIDHHVDHLVPFCRGGKHGQNNLRVVTAQFNLRKWDKLACEYNKYGE